MIENVPKIKFNGTKVVLLNKNTFEQLTIECTDAGVFFSNFKDRCGQFVEGESLEDWLIFYAIPQEEVEPLTEEVSNG